MILHTAIEFVIEAHKKQLRKFDNCAYVKHPLAVMGILSEYTQENEALAAAILHDTVEDCEDITLEIIHEIFGEVVGSYVFYCSAKSQKSDGTRAVRKEIDRRHYSSGPAISQNIKICDMMDNIPSFVLYDKKFALVYINEKLQLLGALNKADTKLKAKALNLISQMLTLI